MAARSAGACQFNGDQVNEPHRSDRRERLEDGASNTDRDAGMPPAQPQAASVEADGIGALQGTVALLRFDIESARAAIRYRDQRIAALEASLEEGQPDRGD